MNVTFCTPGLWLTGILLIWAIAGLVVAVIAMSQSYASGEGICRLEQEAILMIDQASESYLTKVERLLEAYLERRQPYDSR